MDETIGTKSSEPPTIYNAELIAHAARVGHETVWMYATATGTGPQLPYWDDASDFLKDQAIRLVLVAAADERAEAIHRAWVDMMLLAGWCYAQGPTNAVEKTNPALVPWDRLLPGQRARVEVFRAAVRGVLGMG